MLNSEQIIEEKLLKLDHTHGKPAQVGYDLSLKEVQKVGLDTEFGKIGKVLKNKTELTTYINVNPINLDGVKGWLLHPGTYNITFWEGCKLPANRVAFIKQRSSLYRNGAIINSPVFDPGFETEFMGTIMYVNETIFIEENSRVAQFLIFKCDHTELYNGQFMFDKQRDK